MAQNSKRYLLQVTLETTAPLRIGSGEKSIKTDSPVVRDVNGLPFIPGTTLAGLIAHALGKEEKERLMGSQQNGSRLILTEAKLVGQDGRAIDGLLDWTRLEAEQKAFLEFYRRLPVRQHVRIGHKGTVQDTGKFDEEVVLKGSRFCFEMELTADAADKTDVQKDIDTLAAIFRSPLFRIGSGSRSGFGAVKVVKCLSRGIDLAQPDDRKWYLGKPSQIGAEWSGWESFVWSEPESRDCPYTGWTRYRLRLQPEDFVLFGSGFSDPDTGADMSYVRETVIVWDETEKGTLVEQEKSVLIPAASVKGALSHRTAFYYNQRKGKAVSCNENGQWQWPRGETAEAFVGTRNAAVKALFGSEGRKNSATGRVEDKQRGNVLISDVIETREHLRSKTLTHVSIDRFTGGAVDGALFTEQVLYAYAPGEEFVIDLLVADAAITDDDIRTAFEAALKDAASGMLPLGGGVNRGNGIFTGEAEKFDKENKEWERLL